MTGHRKHTIHYLKVDGSYSESRVPSPPVLSHLVVPTISPGPHQGLSCSFHLVFLIPANVILRIVIKQA